VVCGGVSSACIHFDLAVSFRSAFAFASLPTACSAFFRSRASSACGSLSAFRSSSVMSSAFSRSASFVCTAANSSCVTSSAEMVTHVSTVPFSSRSSPCLPPFAPSQRNESGLPFRLASTSRNASTPSRKYDTMLNLVPPSVSMNWRSLRPDPSRTITPFGATPFPWAGHSRASTLHAAISAAVAGVLICTPGMTGWRARSCSALPCPNAAPASPPVNINPANTRTLIRWFAMCGSLHGAVRFPGPASVPLFCHRPDNRHRLKEREVGGVVSWWGGVVKKDGVPRSREGA
jgi:hypothetical protein